MYNPTSPGTSLSWAQLQPMPFLRGLQLSLIPQESSWPAQLGRVASIKDRSLLASSRKNSQNKLGKSFTQGSGAQGGEGQRYAPASLRCFVAKIMAELPSAIIFPAGTAKCRNPLGRQSELVRREPAESVRLERRIRYKK